MDNDIFTLIKEDKEKIKLWNDLGSAKSEIIFKGVEDALCKVRVSFYNTKISALETNFDGKNILKSQEEYLAYFFIGAEKYYFQGKAQVFGTSMLVPLPTELYKLQRRQNYRVRIPETYPAFYNALFINDTENPISGNLADLSSQGCRVVYKLSSPELNIGDKIVGELKIKDRPSIEVQGIVRHIKSETVSKKVQQVFGIEFLPLSPITESKLFAITMEIHKEIFKRPV